MALNSTVFRVQYTANGATTAFSFPYLFLDETHLVVVETNTTTGVDTTKSLTTDYTVTGEGLAAGGTVTFIVAPANGRRITISRIVPITQLTDYNQSDAFPADSHEAALDKLTMIAQQLNSSGGDVDRSIRYPTTEPSGFTAELPAAVDRTGKVISFDATTGDMIITQELGQWRGNWVTATDYVSRDLVRNGTTGNVYIATGDFTSSGSIATDISNGDLDLVIDVLSTPVYLNTQFVTLASDSNLSSERVLAVSGGLNLTDGGAGSNVTIGIPDAALTYAKIQNVSATDKILGRSTAGAGVVEEIDCTAAGRALLDDANAAAQRTTLGLTIGTDVQAYDAELAAIAGLTSAADKLPYFTGSGTAALADMTAAGRALLDDASASAQRTTLGLGALAVLDRATSIRDSINQVSHGFVAKDVLKFAAGVWSKAQADSAANSEAIGIVESATDSDNFIIVYAGKLTVSGLTQNSEYFLSPSSAGAITTTEPSTAGQIRRSIGLAISTTEMIVRIQQPGVQVI